MVTVKPGNGTRAWSALVRFYDPRAICPAILRRPGVNTAIGGTSLISNFSNYVASSRRFVQFTGLHKTGRRRLKPSQPLLRPSLHFEMLSPLANLSGAVANFSRSRVNLNETIERPVPKLLTRDIYHVEKVCQRGPAFSLSDLVGLPILMRYPLSFIIPLSARICRRSEEYERSGY